jgi:hypothetical protein
MAMPLPLCSGKQSINEQRLSINVDRRQLLRLHALGCVPVIMAHDGHEFVLIVIATILGTITQCIFTFGPCEMDRESRLDHISLADSWLGISANSWRSAKRSMSLSTRGPLLCSTDPSPA